MPLDSLTKKYGGVAQLVRVFGSHPKGRGFESLRLHHFCTVRFDGLFFSVRFLFGPRALSAGAFLWSGLCCVGGNRPEKGRASFPDVGGEKGAAFGQASRHLWKDRHSPSRNGRGKGGRGHSPCYKWRKGTAFFRRRPLSFCRRGEENRWGESRCSSDKERGGRRLSVGWNTPQPFAADGQGLAIPGCQTAFWCVFAGEISVRRAEECAALAAVQPDMQGERRRFAREICTKQMR